jgi:hypothetical protein
MGLVPNHFTTDLADLEYGCHLAGFATTPNYAQQEGREKRGKKK